MLEELKEVYGIEWDTYKMYEAIASSLYLSNMPI